MGNVTAKPCQGVDAIDSCIVGPNYNPHRQPFAIGPFVPRNCETLRQDEYSIENVLSPSEVGRRYARAEAVWPGIYNSRTRSYEARDPALRRNSTREFFAVPEFIQLLRRHSIGAVVADTVEGLLWMDVTTDFVYCRSHGSELLYASGYEDAALDLWADRVAAWTRGTRCMSTWITMGRCVASFDAKSLRERAQRRLDLSTKT
jgi:hypothetical protein